jgi:hypothetical protein
MARHFGKTPRPSRITMAPGAHALVKVTLAEMRRRCRTYEAIEFDSGVLRGTMKEWRKPGKLPRITSLEAVLGALGWGMAALPFASTLPAPLRRDLEALIDRYAAAVPAFQFLPEVPGVAGPLNG